MTTLTSPQELLRTYINQDKAAFFPRFFKAGKGEYAEGDMFIGVTVPHIRLVAKKYSDLSLNKIEKLLDSRIHEERLLSLLILVDQYEKGDSHQKKIIHKFYLSHTQHINNWDLVDLSCYKIVGSYLLDKDRSVLYQLAESDNLWERRIAIISTFQFIRHNEFEDTFKIAKVLLRDKHDLIHKAVGWMLREVGKRDLTAEKEFLKNNLRTLPRTSLRYAIERFPEQERKAYLYGTVNT